ncbi:MAG: zinc ribbon domain-containing protein [Fibrobacteria bacterium]|nr:zinc ribbon domain-containing protein [Fibrobacteria bacterium]
MPTYVYRDPVTGFTKEVFHSMKDSPEVINEATGNAMERVISGGAGFLFKGDGFYQTDYRSDSYKSAASSDAAPAPACASGGCAGGACGVN